MRVGLFIEHFNPARGGRERSTAEIARGLVERGCEVEIVCMTGVAGDDAVKVTAVDGRGVSRTGRFRRFVTLAGRRAAEGGYDVTHAMFPLPGVDFYQLRSGTFPGLRAGHLRRRRSAGRALRAATWSANRLRACQGRLERRVMADTRTTVLPVSTMVAGEIERFYGRTDRVRTILNGARCPDVDDAVRAGWRAEMRRLWGLADDDVAVVCPAMNYALKGVDKLLEAFGRICWREEGEKLRLIVLGPQRPRVRPSVRGADVVGDRGPIDTTPIHVQFHPAVADIWPVYAGADAVALLSWYDACSRVVLEAVGFGAPCVTTAFNGAAEVLTDGAGLVVSSPAAVDETAAALMRLADPQVRDDCRRACRRAARRVSMDRHVDELMAAYREARRP